MNITILILGIVIGGIATLVTLVFTIISLASGKTQNGLIWGIGFLVAISILVISIFNVVRRIGEKVKHGIEWAAEQHNNTTYPAVDTDTDYQKTERQNFLDTLQFYTSESAKAKLPVNFYVNKPAEQIAGSKLLVPFVYPLSIHYSKENGSGDIASAATDSVYLTNVTQMAFDENFVIAKVDNSTDKALLKSGRAEIEYVLFDMRTREFLSFVNLEQLLDKSFKIGYVGPMQMNYLSDDYMGWTDSQEDYD